MEHYYSTLMLHCLGFFVEVKECTVMQHGNDEIQSKLNVYLKHLKSDYSERLRAFDWFSLK